MAIAGFSLALVAVLILFYLSFSDMRVRHQRAQPLRPSLVRKLVALIAIASIVGITLMLIAWA
jgi:hypothetical protein